MSIFLIKKNARQKLMAATGGRKRMVLSSDSDSDAGQPPTAAAGRAGLAKPTPLTPRRAAPASNNPKTPRLGPAPVTSGALLSSDESDDGF